MVVAHEFVERDEIVGEFLLAGAGEETWHRRIAGKEAGDMIGRAAHQAEGRFGPGLGEQAAARADRHGVFGICQARCTGAPVFGEGNVMRSRLAGSAAMS